MSVNLFLAKEISQSKQKSKYFTLCHVGDFSEGTGDMEEYHFINKYETQLKRIKFLSLLPDSYLQDYSCDPKSH